mmetsp:Transcript_23519/g.32913  ORF Transcript_23519/g.32913 Transcript_23519/m.32913 type:complete len:213 (-) Transcript_23519:770-1408(-)
MLGSPHFFDGNLDFNTHFSISSPCGVNKSYVCTKLNKVPNFSSCGNLRLICWPSGKRIATRTTPGPIGGSLAINFSLLESFSSALFSSASTSSLLFLSSSSFRFFSSISATASISFFRCSASSRFRSASSAWTYSMSWISRSCEFCLTSTFLRRTSATCVSYFCFTSWSHVTICSTGNNPSCVGTGILVASRCGFTTATQGYPSTRSLLQSL